MVKGQSFRSAKAPVVYLTPRPLLLTICYLLIGLSWWQATASQGVTKSLDSSVRQLALSISTPPKLTAGHIKKHSPATSSTPPQLWRGPVEPVVIAPGNVQVFYKIPTALPVVFVGIDDGWVQIPETLAWLIKYRLPFSLFLTDNGIKNNYSYFGNLQSAGMGVEDHTVSHPDLTRLNLAKQKAEICGAADTYQGNYGHRPTLFRPPYGAYNQKTLQAASDCGIHSVVMWHALVVSGSVQFQDGLTHLEPGDIVLMHFTPDFLNDIKVFSDEVRKDRLQVARLEDWLP